MTDLPSPQDAVASFIYGYPLVYDLDEVAGFVQGGGSLPVSAPWNTFAYARGQDEFRLASHEATIVPAGVPVADSTVGDDLRWWETFRVQLAAFPPPAGDAEFLERCERLGLADELTPYADPTPELRALLIEAERTGRETIDALMAGGADLVNGWREAAHLFDYNLDHFEVGTIDAPEWKIADRTTAYATRAVAARAGLWGNHGYEADYFITSLDADGEQLSGAHTYELRLETPPPVDAFWSLTMYDTPDFYLVDNPIDRYSIGDRTPGLVTADDGSITILLQTDSPGADLDANWLPAPAGDFRLIMRLYEPGAPVLAGIYELPAIRRTN